MVIKAFNTPWKIINKISQWFYYPFIHLIFSLNGISWKNSFRFYGIPRILKYRQSLMLFGSNFQLRSTILSNPLSVNHPVVLCTWQPGAKLVIGDNFGMTGGVICAAEKITIGNNVAVGANTTIVDTDFHPIDPLERKIHPASAKTAPIVIEDDVFIGMSCLVLKGVTIGKGSVIGAGSVVTKSIPPGVIAAGNPAKVIRKLDT